jgi:hypothetical protein
VKRVRGRRITPEDKEFLHIAGYGRRFGLSFGFGHGGVYGSPHLGLGRHMND